MKGAMTEVFSGVGFIVYFFCFNGKYIEKCRGKPDFDNFITFTLR